MNFNILKLIKDNYKILIYIVLFILAYLLTTEWLKDKIIVALGGYTDREVVVETNTEYVQGKVDTIAFFNHYVTTHGINLNPKPKIIYKYKTVAGEVIKDSIKEFTVAIKDTLLNGKFIVQNNFKGDLLNSTFTYKPLFPKYLIRTDTIKITNTVTNTLTNKRSLIGLGVGYNNLHYFSILGSYTTKSKLQFMYEYGKPLNETISIINGIPFQTNSSDLHSIKLIKHF